MDTPTKKMCRDCPWRRSHPPGWLGGYSADHFVTTIKCEVPIPCHKTLESSDPERSARICRGSLVMMKNSCKLPRDPVLASARQQVERDDTVFSSLQEFKDYHEQLS